MAELVRISMQLKGGELAGAMQLRLLRDKTRPLPSYLVNKACREIARRAEAAMPVVLPAQMDAELDVTYSPAILKSGERSSAKNRQREVMHIPLDAKSLAMMIVVARLWPGSKYNIRTGNVWQLDRPQFNPQGEHSQGTGRAEFWLWVQQKAERMIRARHSSSGFFRVCAKVVWFIFKDATAKNPVERMAAMTGVEALPGGGNVTKNIGRLAGGIVSTGTGEMARASFWVAATEPDTKGKPGGAIYKIAQPVWQRAVDDEAASIKSYAESLYSQAAREAGITVK
jgi:hypothetical protein